MNMDMYIGTSQDYAIGAKVPSQSVVFYDMQLAREYAHAKAEERGALFGNVYRIAYEIDETKLFAERRPTRIEEHVAWSI